MTHVHHSSWRGTGRRNVLRLVNCRSLKFSCCSDTPSIGFCCTLSPISAAAAYNTASTTDWWLCFCCTLSVISAAAAYKTASTTDRWLSFLCLFLYTKGSEAGTGCDVTNCGRDMIKGGPVVVARRMSSALGLDKSYLLLVHHNCIYRTTYIPHIYRTTTDVWWCAHKQGYLFASDLKMCTGICPGDIPLIQCINK